MKLLEVIFMILEHLFGYCCITWFEMKMSRIQVQAIAPCHSPRRDSRLTILRLYVGMLLRSLRALSAVPAVLAASGVHGYVHCAPKRSNHMLPLVRWRRWIRLVRGMGPPRDLGSK